MPEEKTGLRVREVITLNKFEGELDPNGEPAPGQTPVEAITLEDGEVTRHVVRDEVVFDREQGVDPRPEHKRGERYHPHPEANPGQPDTTPPGKDKENK